MRTIEIKGNKLAFADNGNRINIKGIDYQPTDNVDPITDADLDIIKSDYNNYWKALNINTIRVYQINPDASHDLVMAFLESKGIYVMVGMVNNVTSIYRFDGGNNFNYTTAIARVKAVADCFSVYTNVLCYSVSNEMLYGTILQDKSSSNPNATSVYAPSYVKGIVKELKSHISGQSASNYRKNIPVGVVLRDDDHFSMDGMNYYISGTIDERADYIGYNCYRWGPGNLAGRISAYETFYEFIKPISQYVPVVMTEYGSAACVDANGARSFTQIPYLFGATKLSNGKDMSDQICGGAVFRFILRNESLGLYSGTETTSGGLTVTAAGGAANLGTQYAAIEDEGGAAGSASVPTSIPVSSGNQFDKPIPSV